MTLFVAYGLALIGMALVIYLVMVDVGQWSFEEVIGGK